jgi:uncharacterized protein (TIGR03435 family)
MLVCASWAGWLAAAAFGQDIEASAKFEAADAHASAPARNQGLRALVRGGQYELRSATMVDLVRIAYGVDADRVLEGPSWLEWDRFDVIAKGPARVSTETQRSMMRALLADRFKLVVRNDTREMPAYNLSAGKRPALKKASGNGETGCQLHMPGPGQFDSGPPVFTYTCRSMTMARLADGMSSMIGVQPYLFGEPVLDKTGLEGAWDFDFKYSFRGFVTPQGGDTITIFEAMEKQLGLKLEAVKAPLPVIVVESVNRKPTANLPGVAESLRGSAAPTEFEVADVKPSAPDSDDFRFDIKPGGRVNIGGMTLRNLILQAWDLRPDMLVGGPKSMDEDRFDIVAKAPPTAESTELVPGPLFNPGGPAGPMVDFGTMQVMLQGLLKDRFKLAMHEEERPVDAYTLVAVKPKIKTADPASRTKFIVGPTPNTRNQAPGTRMVTVQNMTMVQFAEQLQRIAPGYIRVPVLDATRLEGSYDFTLMFAPAGAVRGGGGGRGGKRGGPGGDAPTATGEASDPTGAMSLPEAIERTLGLKLEQQKRPVKVWVVDHVERAPTAN